MAMGDDAARELDWLGGRLEEWAEEAAEYLRNEADRIYQARLDQPDPIERFFMRDREAEIRAMVEERDDLMRRLWQAERDHERAEQARQAAG